MSLSALTLGQERWITCIFLTFLNGWQTKLENFACCTNFIIIIITIIIKKIISYYELIKTVYFQLLALLPPLLLPNYLNASHSLTFRMSWSQKVINLTNLYFISYLYMHITFNLQDKIVKFNRL